MSENIVQRVIQNNYLELTRDLELTPTLKGQLIHYGLFNEDMLDDIMSERTRKCQIQLMLKKLQRRGPRAMEKFERAIQDDYPWLAEKLRKTHHQLHNFHRDVEEMSLKKRVDIYVHEKFGNSKRLSEEDKKEIRVFLFHQLSNRTSNADGENSEETTPQMPVHEPMDHTGQQSDRIRQETHTPATSNLNLNRLYRLLSYNPDDEDQVDCGEICPPCDISVEKIEEQAKQLTSQLKNLQNEVTMCYSLLGVDNRDSAQPLTEIVRQSVAELQELRDMKEDLDRVQRQRDKLELLLESTKEELQKKINRLSHTALENEKCRAQMKDLKEKCERLESVQLQQLEKQETLYRLKEIVRELSPVRKSMTSSQTNMTENLSDMYKPPTHKSRSHKLPKIKSGSQTSSSYQSPLGSKSISYHHHHHHHYSDPTVASREHTIKPGRLGSREELLAPIHLPR